MIGDMLFLPTAWACETGLPPETGIPRLWDNTILVNCRTGEYTQFIPPYPSEG